MKWQIKYNPLISKDLKRIGREWADKIIRAIEIKLGSGPEKYGKPLRASLKGYWKLRVNDYRVVYKIEQEQILVCILHVGIRRDFEVYREVLKRLVKT